MTINCLESTNLSAKKVNENESVTKPKDDAKLKAPLPLVNNIDMVNRMYNQPTTLVFNEENLYLSAGTE